MSILKDLWETYQADHPFEVCEEKKKLTALLVEYEEKQETMTGEQRAVVQSIEECWCQMCDVGEREAFVKGVRFGVMLMAEIFSANVQKGQL